MIENKITSKLPTPSLMLILICSTGILAFYLLIIFPDQKTSAYLDTQAERTNLQIEKQKVFAPIYRKFKEILDQSMQINNLELPLPKKTKLDQNDTYMIQPILEDMIIKSHLKVERIEPDVTTIIEDSELLKIDLSLTGDFSDFRTFLIMLGEKIPSLEYIERIKIQRVKGTKQLWLDLRIWLARA